MKNKLRKYIRKNIRLLFEEETIGSNTEPKPENASDLKDKIENTKNFLKDFKYSEKHKSDVAKKMRSAFKDPLNPDLEKVKKLEFANQIKNADANQKKAEEFEDTIKGVEDVLNVTINRQEKKSGIESASPSKTPSSPTLPSVPI